MVGVNVLKLFETLAITLFCPVDAIARLANELLTTPELKLVAVALVVALLSVILTLPF